MATDVAVLVLNLDGRERLLRCLEGCARLDRDGIRLRVVCIDNGSRDGSLASVRRRHPGISLIANPRNLGFARAYNEAVRAVDADWVALLNNDAVPEPSWLTAALAAARRHGAACVGSRMLKDGGARIDFVGSSMNFYGHGFHPRFDEPAADAGEERPMLFACAGAMLCRRDVFLSSGGFDEAYFAYFEDLDLGWRLNVLGHDVVYAPDSVVQHEHAATSSTIVPPHQKLAWLERNGLRSVVKNYGEERLGRVLPAAIALCVKRAQLDSAVDPDRYFFERTGPSGGAAATASSPAASRLRRAGAALRARGPVDGTLYLAHRLLARRFANGGHLPAGHEAVDRTGFARIAALDAVVRDAPALQAERERIQCARRRPDEAVVALFLDTFRPSFPHPELAVLQEVLVNAFGLAELFP